MLGKHNRISKSAFNKTNVKIEEGILDMEKCEFYDVQLMIGEKQEPMLMNGFKGKNLFTTLECTSLIINDSSIDNFTIYIENDALIVKNSNFTDLFMVSDGVNNLFENCRIESCELWTQGTEIIDCSITDLKELKADHYIRLKDSNFTRTGEIYNSLGDILIDNCTFTNCNPERLITASYLKDKLIIMNSRFINNTCKSLIDFEGCEDITLKNNLFLNNTCSKLLSWDIYIYYESGKKPNVYVNIQNNAFINNLENDRQYSKIDLATSMMDFTGKLKPFHFKIENNFLGFNMDHKRELYTIPVFDLSAGEPETQYDIMTWTNINIVKNGAGYALKAVNNKKEEVNLPETLFSIKDRKTGETIVSNIRIGESFNMNRTPEEVYILNEANEIVNKPKANFTYTITGDSYEDILIKAHVEYDSKPLKNQIICMDIIETQVLGTFGLERTYTTDENGDVILFTYNTHNPPTYGQEFENDEAYKYDFILTHSSREFGMSQIIHKNLKIKPAECIVSGGDITTVYGKKPVVKMSVKTRNGKTIQGCQIIISIYKNNKLVRYAYDYASKGVIEYKLAKLNAGTYKLRIESANGKYSLKKTITVKVNPLKLKVKVKKATHKFKKKQYFKFTVKNAKKVKVKLKIGKKTYKVKTDKKGVAKFNTKSLKRGTHKVTISSGDGNYKFSAKSSIKIR